MIDLNFKRLNSFANALENTVRNSGKAIMKVYNSDFEIAIKKDESPVTKADTIAEKIILEDLTKLSQDIPIIAEENTAEFGFPSFKGNTFWCVDALDGTKEFINLKKDFTVNIGLIVNGKPSLGLIYAPAKNTLYRGTSCNITNQRHSIVERSGQRTPISVRRIPEKGAVIARSASHGTKKEMEEFLKKYKIDEIIAIGSSLKFCMIAEGIADFYPRFGPTHEWDTAAGHAILTAAGGSVKMPDGNELTYKKEKNNYCNGTFIATGLT